MKYRVNSSHEIDLADGKVVSPGDNVSLNEKESQELHNMGLIQDGTLVQVESASEEPQLAAPEKAKPATKKEDDK